MFRCHCLSYRLALTIFFVGFLLNIGKALIIEYSLSELTQKSDIIVRGRVLSTECRWGNPDWDPNSKIIFTFITIAVKDFYKGASDKRELVIETEGGEVGEIGLSVEDMPHFEKGEEVIVFLSEETSKGSRKVINLYNGKYTLVKGRVLERNEPINRFVDKIKQAIKSERRER